MPIVLSVLIIIGAAFAIFSLYMYFGYDSDKALEDAIARGEVRRSTLSPEQVVLDSNSESGSILSEEEYEDRIHEANLVKTYERYQEELDEFRELSNRYVQQFNKLVEENSLIVSSYVNVAEDFTDNHESFKQRSDSFKQFINSNERELQELGADTFGAIQYVDNAITKGRKNAEVMAERIENVANYNKQLAEQTQAEQEMIANILKLLIAL